MEGQFIVDNGKVKMVEEEGLDFSAVTVQMPGGERVPFLFTVKQLSASGAIDGEIKGDFLVPSYRGSTFLDPKVSIVDIFVLKSWIVFVGHSAWTDVIDFMWVLNINILYYHIILPYYNATNFMFLYLFHNSTHTI